MKKRIAGMFVLAAAVANLGACSAASSLSTSAVASAAVANSQVSTVPTRVTGTATTAAATATATTSADYDTEDADAEVAADAAQIKLNGNSISFTGSGATVNGSTITITKAGTYRISGKLTNGQVIVDTQDAEKVVLALDGADITSSTSSPIYVANAEKVVITLVKGSQNTVTDGTKYVYPDAETTEPDATIFSHDDLTINGAGSLTVNANYNNGIAGKDDLKITGGNITVTAVNDAVKGRDSLAIKDGVLTVKAGNDGLQASNDEEAEQGYVVIEGGTINVTAEDDAVNAVTSITVDGGELTVAAGGDALHSDGSIVVNGGSVDILQSYEGVESDQITVNNGEVTIVSSDDGINAVSATASSSGMGGFGGGGGGTSSLTINGGTVAVDALGDGLDINGSINMTGGTLLVNGPVQNNNGSIDYDATFNMTGGLLVAAGSAGMAQAPGATSTQYSLMHVFPQAQAVGTTVRIVAQDGSAVASFTPTKTYQTILVSSPELVNGGTYQVYVGNLSVASYTLTSVVTGAPAGGMGGGRGMRPRP